MYSILGTSIISPKRTSDGERAGQSEQGRFSDRSAGGTRTLHLHITTPRQVPWVEVSIGSTSPISAITLAGKHISYENDPGQSHSNGYMKTFQYWVQPEQGFDFAVEVSRPGSVKVFVRNYGFGLPQVPGFSYDPRPADRMPLAREFLPKNRTDTVLVSKSFVFDEEGHDEKTIKSLSQDLSLYLEVGHGLSF